MLGLMQQRPLLISSLVDHAANRHGTREIVSRDKDGAIPPHDLRAARWPRQTPRQCAGGAGRRLRRPRRHARLERLSASGAVLRRDRQRPRAAHGQPTPVPRADPVHHSIMPATTWCSSIRSSSRWSSNSRRICRRCATGSRCAARTRCRKSGWNPCCATRTCWRRRRPTTTGPRSTRTPRRRSATPRARRAIRRACCTAIARPCCTPSPPAPRTGFAFSARDTILVVVPLFHANAWSVPFAAAMCGAKLVLPGPKLDPESLFLLMEQEACTAAGGIPTIWLNFLALGRGQPRSPGPIAARAEARVRRRHRAAARYDREIP